MTLLKNHISRTLLAILLITSLSSCTEDFWRDNDFYYSLNGGWRVVEVTGRTAYRPGDCFWFNSDGSFYTEGYSLNERGQWEANGRTINFSFDGYNVDMAANVRQFDNGYMVLDVNDYYDNTRYTLRLTRVY